MVKRHVTSIVATAPAPPPSKPGLNEHDYQAESDGHHLTRAHEIMNDKARHGRALEHLKRQHAQLSEIVGHEPDTGGDRYGQGFRRLQYVNDSERTG